MIFKKSWVTQFWNVMVTFTQKKLHDLECTFTTITRLILHLNPKNRVISKKYYLNYIYLERQNVKTQILKYQIWLSHPSGLSPSNH